MQIVLTIKLRILISKFGMIVAPCTRQSRRKTVNTANVGCYLLTIFPIAWTEKDYYVECGDNFKVRWDRYTPREVTPWSERCDTIDEVGSVYTIQGFDLNYAGVILGRSIGYDAANDCIKLRPELYDDRAGFTKRKTFTMQRTLSKRLL